VQATRCERVLGIAVEIHAVKILVTDGDGYYKALSYCVVTYLRKSATYFELLVSV